VAFLKFERMIGPELNQIRKGFFHLPETGNSQKEKESNNGKAYQEARKIKWAFRAENAPAETVNHARHGIETVNQSPLFRNHLAGEAHRRNIKTKLHDKWDNITKIVVFYIQGGNPKTWSQAGQQRHHDKKGQQQDVPSRRKTDNKSLLKSGC